MDGKWKGNKKVVDLVAYERRIQELEAENAKQREALELARPIVEKQTRCKLELIGNQIRAREVLAKIDEVLNGRD